MLLTTGERISISLVTMAIEDLGVPAISFTGSQAGIVTDTEHNRAKIIEVKGDRVRQALAEGKVAVVAGAGMKRGYVHGVTDELAANPEYLAPRAYERLAAAVREPDSAMEQRSADIRVGA